MHAILGPNGAGKTTILRILAGLLRLGAGFVRLDDVVLDEPASGTYVVPERRPIGVVFQDYLLFPYLTARDMLEEALKTAPNDASLHYHLGMTYTKLSDKANAETHLKKAVALAPNTQAGKDAQKELSSLS